MGGAVATRIGVNDNLPGVIGLINVDVVEGTAVAGLSAMPNFLRSRPNTFDSLEQALRW